MGTVVDADTARNLSLFRPLGYQRNSCGYCKSSNGSASYYASSVSVRPEHYETLVNRGWRRSGTLYYKQNLQRSCCPHYTLRLDVSDYKARRDQRKAINRWNNYVLGPEYIRKAAMLAPKSREEKRERKQKFDVVKAVHAAEYTQLPLPIDPKTKRPIQPAHKFEVTIEGDSLSQRKYEVFLKYQETIHKESTERWKTADFKRFLCSGLKRNAPKEGSDEKKLGSWHQCYRLDGRLIAVAVLDLLPEGVSSVYLFYDPEFGAWEFGKLSALREIAFALEQDYKYYYMGYYIHSCQKMIYKSHFRPQYILDPEGMTWDPLAGELAQKLDKRKYVSLSRDRARQSLVTDDDKEQKEDEQLPKLVDEESLSLFSIRMPGVLTADQVLGGIDLDHWLLLAYGTFIHMEDLVGWENANITDPQSVKGIVGELVAVLGVEVAKKSACVLFD